MTPSTERHTDPLILIPLDAIDEDALPRDRSTVDEEALQTLIHSITATGLRAPIEVWALSTPRDGHTHGLISGQRRLTAFRRIAAMRQGANHTEIPAFVRTPASIAAAMADMIAENELRAQISPWEKGRILIDAVAEEIFPTLDAAVKGLHPHLSRQDQSRLRTLAALAEEMPTGLTAPETLSLRQCLRLSAALRNGFGPIMGEALKDCLRQSPETQWARLLPFLLESERPPEEVADLRPGRPRRMLSLRQGLTIRREMSGNDWILRFSGPEARRGGLMDDVFDKVELWFQPGEG